MKNKALYDALPFLESIDKERQEQFIDYFRTAPLWLMDAFQVEEVDKDVILVNEGDPADMIFFVGQGIIEGIDFRAYGTPYDYMQFHKVYAMGGMEFIMNLKTYKTTLRTVTKCIIVKLPRATFEKWLYSDIEAMKKEASLVCEYLLEEVRNNRLFLFLQGSDRLAMLLVNRYEQHNKNGILTINTTRQNLADETGLCLKSISRGVKKFAESGIITKENKRITINREQYEQLRDIVSEKIDLD